MPTNQQRRDAAKRKLERQLVRRQERARTRRRRTILASVIVGVLVTAGVIWMVTAEPAPTEAAGAVEEPTAAPCSYTETEQGPVKSVLPPENTNPLTEGTVEATITLADGALPATLDRSLAPCAVNAFVSLASQGFYDSTECHRLTTDDDLRILQCGDPSGTGRGGPGYTYAAESNPFVGDPADPMAEADQYPVGTLAMATPTPGGDNGSQFFIVYGESNLGSSGYTKIGTVSEAGIAIVEQVAAKGTVAGSNPNGALDKPAEPVTITSVTVPAEAAGATEPPAVETTATETTGTEVAPTDLGTATESDSPGTESVPSEAAATDGAATESAATSG